MAPLQVRKELVGGSFMLLEADLSLAVKEKRAADLIQPLCMQHVAFTQHLAAYRGPELLQHAESTESMSKDEKR
jgi:hypothetical protein